MPLYEYECGKCGYTKEVLVIFSDKTTKDIICPDCNIKMDKIMSLSNFQLNGGGWAKDGY